MKAGYIYILSNQKNGTLYIGVTNNLVKRVYEHKSKLIESFSSRYNVVNLVYWEHSESIESAIAREKQLKKWNREWKLRLINQFNPDWVDLYESIV